MMVFRTILSVLLGVCRIALEDKGPPSCEDFDWTVSVHLEMS